MALLAGRYTPVDVIGRGRWSEVHLCEDRLAEPGVDPYVAVKVLRLDNSEPGVVQEMFRREQSALDGFSHPHVAKLLRAHEATHSPLLLVLEAIGRGETLDRAIAKRPSAPPLYWRVTQALGLIDALQQAHARGVIHRDIKPGNVLFDPNNERLVLVDFGIASVTQFYAQGKSQETLRDFFTRPFASPEQRLGRDASYPADTYALSWVLQMLLAWRCVDAEDPRTLEAALREALAESALSASTDAAADTVEQLCDALLRAQMDDTSERTTLAELALQMARLRALCRPITDVGVVLTNTARRKIADEGAKRPSDVLDELSSDLRVVRQVGSNGDSDVILRCLGPASELKLRLNEHNELIAVDFFVPTDLEPHGRRRDKAHAAPFRLRERRTSGLALWTWVTQAEHQRQAEQVDETARRKETDIGRHLLERQQARLNQVHLELKPIETTDGLGSDAGDWKHQLASLGAKLPAAANRPVGEYLKFQVAKAWTGAVDEPPSDEDSGIAQWVYDELDAESDVFEACVGNRAVGRLHAINADDVTIRLTRSWTPRPVVMTFKDTRSETAIKRQVGALNVFVRDESTNSRLAELILHPDRNTRDAHPALSAVQPMLVNDHETMELVRQAMAARDFYVLQGPPGAGKTTFIIELIAQILLSNPRARILLASQSNEAVDNAIEGVRTARDAVGATWRIVRDWRDKGATEVTRKGFDYDYRAWSEETTAESKRAWRDGESQMLVRSDGVHAALAKWQEQLARRSDAQQEYATAVHVWGMTLLRVPTLERRLLEAANFDFVIVDEAARAIDSELLVALVQGRRFVLVGDHKQLPPFFDQETRNDIRVADFDEADVLKSKFEKLFEALPATNRAALTKQFRMHPSIGDLIGQTFYPELRLRHGVKHEDRPLPFARFGGRHRVFWVDVAGEEARRSGSKSLQNLEEARVIVGMLTRLEAEAAATHGDGIQGQLENNCRHRVAVIAAYRDQAELLKQRIRPRDKGWKHLDIQVATVDAFQGREADTVIWSMVRAGTGSLAFVSDERRLNVALSRARALLLVVGHRETALQGGVLAEVAAAIGDECVLTAEEVM